MVIDNYLVWTNSSTYVGSFMPLPNKAYLDFVDYSQQANEEEEEKEDAMKYDKLAYLRRRVEAEYQKFSGELVGKYNLYVDNSPSNFRELLDMIQNNKFTIDAKIAKRVDLEIEETAGSLRGPFFGIIWQGPQPDKVGYEAALTSLNDARDDTLDIIHTQDEVIALAALEAFKKWMPPAGTAAN